MNLSLQWGKWLFTRSKTTRLILIGHPFCLISSNVPTEGTEFDEFANVPFDWPHILSIGWPCVREPCLCVCESMRLLQWRHVHELACVVYVCVVSRPAKSKSKQKLVSFFVVAAAACRWCINERNKTVIYWKWYNLFHASHASTHFVVENED